MEQTIAAVDQALLGVLRRMHAADEADDFALVFRCRDRLDELLDLRLRLPLQRDGNLH